LGYVSDAVRILAAGDYTVAMESKREVDEDITHRVLTLGRGQNEQRRIDHFQYHAWPDHGVPRTTRPLRALARLLVGPWRV
jgi:protein tyrosine phosphatase